MIIINACFMDWEEITRPEREDDVLMPYRFKNILPEIYHEYIVMADYVKRLAKRYGLEHEVDGRWDYLDDLLHGFYEEYDDYSVAHYIFPIMYEHVAIKKGNDILSVMFLGPQFDMVTTLVPNVYIMDAFVRRLEMNCLPFNFDFYKKFYLLFYKIENVPDVYDDDLKDELLIMHGRLKQEFSSSLFSSCLIKRFFYNMFIRHKVRSAIFDKMFDKEVADILSELFKKR